MNLSSYAELAVRLANTVQAPGEPDPLGTASACASALGDCLTGPVTRRDLAVLQHLRAEFNAIFTAAATGDDQAAMDRLNALLLQFPIQPEMVSHDDQRWHVHLAAQGSVADRFAAGAIIGVALTVSLVGVNRLGVCAIASCHAGLHRCEPGQVPPVLRRARRDQGKRECPAQAAGQPGARWRHRTAAAQARDASRQLDQPPARPASLRLATPARRASAQVLRQARTAPRRAPAATNEPGRPAYIDHAPLSAGRARSAF